MLSIEQSGQRTSPSLRVICMLRRATSVLTSLRSWPMTKANCSSWQRGLGRQKLMVMVLELRGLRQVQRISLRVMQLRLAMVVVSRRRPHSITYMREESQRQQTTLWLSELLLMPTPYTTSVKLPAAQNSHPVMVTVTFLLSVLEAQVTGMLVPLPAERQQVLVATVMPLRTRRMLPLARRGLVVPKTKVQQVLTTPTALSWQLMSRDWRGVEQKVPPFIMMKELETSIFCVDLATVQMQQLGRSYVQGMCALSSQNVNGLVVTTYRNGITVRYIPPARYTASGDSVRLPNVAGVVIAEVAAEQEVTPFQKNDHCVHRNTQEFAPVDIELPQTVTDTFFRYDPAFPTMSPAMRSWVLPKGVVTQLPEVLVQESAWTQAMSLVSRLQVPVWQQKYLVFWKICVSGMRM